MSKAPQMHYTTFMFLIPAIQSIWFLDRIEGLMSVRYLVQIILALISFYLFAIEKKRLKSTNEYNLYLLSLLSLAIIIDFQIDFFEGSLFSRIYYCVALLMLYLKRPNYQQAFNAFNIFMIVTCILFCFSFVILFTLPSLLINDALAPIRLQIISDATNIHERFGGFYGYVNASGYIALILLVYGAYNYKFFSVSFFLIVAFFALVLSDSRGAYSILFSCLLLPLFFIKNYQINHPYQRYLFFLFSIAATIFVAHFFLQSENGIDLFSGRDVIASIYLDSLNIENIFFGINDVGVNKLLNNVDLTGAASNAHNLFVDLLVRRGIFCFTLCTLLFVITFISSMRYIRTYSKVYLQLFTIILLSSFSEVLYDFSALNYFGVIFISIYLITSSRNIITQGGSLSSKIKGDMEFS
jgi:hypothetical protein